MQLRLLLITAPCITIWATTFGEAVLRGSNYLGVAELSILTHIDGHPSTRAPTCRPPLDEIAGWVAC